MWCYFEKVDWLSVAYVKSLSMAALFLLLLLPGILAAGANTTSNSTNVIASHETPITVSNGQASVDDHRTTYVWVNVTGLSGLDGDTIMITTQSLNSPSPGVPPIDTQAGYFDVKLTPSSGTIPPDAKADICVGTSIPGATFQYFDGKSWIALSDITTTNDSICGAMPANALDQTNLAVSSVLVSPLVTVALIIFVLLCFLFGLVFVILFFALFAGVFVKSLNQASYQTQISSDFYDKVKQERILGRIEGAFTYTTGKGGERKSACDVVFTENYIVQIYRQELNTVPGIFGFSTTDTFKQNIGGSKVTSGDMKTISELSPNPKCVSEPLPYEKIEWVSLVYSTFGSGQFGDDFKVDVGVMHVRIGGRYLGVRENVLFTKSEFDDAAGLIRKTPLGGKLHIRKEIVAYDAEDL